VHKLNYVILAFVLVLLLLRVALSLHFGSLVYLGASAVQSLKKIAVYRRKNNSLPVDFVY